MISIENQVREQCNLSQRMFRRPTVLEVDNDDIEESGEMAGKPIETLTISDEESWMKRTDENLCVSLIKVATSTDCETRNENENYDDYVKVELD